MRALKKNNIFKTKYLFPLIHFILTFFWEHIIFVFSKNRWEDFFAIPQDDYISNGAETVIVYIISKVFSAIIIVLLWEVIFMLFEKNTHKEIRSIFFPIFLVGFLIFTIYFPSNFETAWDYYVTFSYAIKFLPDYWQSIYTGALYAGCMMVFPHPISILYFQWGFFLCVLWYVYINVENIAKGKYSKYFVLLFIFIPETFYICTEPYRNNIYTTLCLFYFSYLFFNAIYQKDLPSIGSVVWIGVLSAFIGVWRSEGIVLGLLGVCVISIRYFKVATKRIAIIVFAFLVSYALLQNIQNIGEKKYYGNDYMIINTTSVLSEILNNPDSNLDYEGAKEDIAAINRIASIEVIKQLDRAGYRSYNYAKGHKDFNQSLSDKTESEEYMSSYYSLIRHNMKDYLTVQINYFFECMQISYRFPQNKYEGDITVSLEPFEYHAYENGRAEFDNTYFTGTWSNSNLRTSLNEAIISITTAYRNFWINSGINPIIHILALITDCFLLIASFILVFIRRNVKYLYNLLFFGTIILQTIMIILFMPEGREPYLYPMIYASYLIVFLNIITIKKGSK